MSEETLKLAREVMDVLSQGEYIDADPWVVCDTKWRATGRGSDISIDWRVADAHEVKDGKIVREIYGFPDVAAALKAVQAEE